MVLMVYVCDKFPSHVIQFRNLGQSFLLRFEGSLPKTAHHHRKSKEMNTYVLLEPRL